MKKRDLYYERIPTKLLRENVRYLGNILGRVIKEQEGQKFFELVEKIRKLSKANKVNPNINQTNRKVVRAIKNLSPKNSYKITRAFTHFMNFMNLAELIDASRKLNEYENNKKKTSDSNLFIEEIFEDLFNNKNISETKIILKDLLNINEAKVSIDNIQTLVCKYFKISKNEMLSSRRSRYLVRPRQVAIYLSKILTSKSLPEIGREFSNRDHTTIIHSVKTIEKLKVENSEINNGISYLKNQIMYKSENEV